MDKIKIFDSGVMQGFDTSQRYVDLYAKLMWIVKDNRKHQEIVNWECRHYFEIDEYSGYFVSVQDHMNVYVNHLGQPFLHFNRVTNGESVHLQVYSYPGYEEQMVLAMLQWL